MKLHRQNILLTVAKMLRPGVAHMTSRDRAAIEELKTHLRDYLTNDIILLDYIRVLNKRYKRNCIDQQKREEMIASFMDVSDDVLTKAGVSKRDYS